MKKLTMLRCTAYCAVFTVLVRALCVVLVRLLPKVAGLFTSDEVALRFLESASRAQVAPAWGIPLFVSLLLLVIVFLQSLYLKKRQLTPKRTVPLFFTLALWLGFLPVFAGTFFNSQMNTIPVRVVISFAALFLE